MRRPATDINSKQQRILDFIIESLQQRYRCPSVREIGDHMGLSSTSTVQSHLNTLERFGYITRDANKNRAITVVNMPDVPPLEVDEDTNEVTSSAEFNFLEAGLRRVPLIGTVQAGLPVTAIEIVKMSLYYLLLCWVVPNAFYFASVANPCVTSVCTKEIS